MEASASRRPAYHLYHRGPGGGPFDPNAALYWRGRYHLHYIAPEEGGLSYAHVSSTDMVHWVEHPLTLSYRKMGAWLASGTAIIDRQGCPTIIFHGCDPAFCRHGEGIGRNLIAFATDDRLEDWQASPFAVEPELGPEQDPTPIARWDPDLWLEGDTYYALFGFHPEAERNGKKPTLMRSADLRSWEYVGKFFGRDMADVADDEDLSCPNFFGLGNEHMLLCISHNKGCRYYLGEWKNEIFTPRLHARMNWCDQDVFAPESLLTPDGRRVMWAWCIGGGDGWNGIQSLPRELSLPEDGVLRIRPLRELEQLRQAPRREASLLVKAEVACPLPDTAGDAIELAATFRQGEARRCGVRLLCDRNQGKGIDVMVEPRSSRLELGATTAPLELGAGEDIRLRIFVDRGIVEVFANDRQAVMRRHDYAPQDVGVCLLSEGGATEIREAVGWQMRAVDPADVQDPGSGR